MSYSVWRRKAKGGGGGEEKMEDECKRGMRGLETRKDEGEEPERRGGDATTHASVEVEFRPFCSLEIPWLRIGWLEAVNEGNRGELERAKKTKEGRRAHHLTSLSSGLEHMYLISTPVLRITFLRSNELAAPLLLLPMRTPVKVIVLSFAMEDQEVTWTTDPILIASFGFLLLSNIYQNELGSWVRRRLWLTRPRMSRPTGACWVCSRTAGRGGRKGTMAEEAKGYGRA